MISRETKPIPIPKGERKSYREFIGGRARIDGGRSIKKCRICGASSNNKILLAGGSSSILTFSKGLKHLCDDCSSKASDIKDFSASADKEDLIFELEM